MQKRCALVIAVALPVLGASASCLDPTEVTLDVATDLPCGETKGTTFTGGTLGAVESAAPSTSTARCEGGSIGTLVATPAGSKDSNAAFVVVLGVDRPASECNAANRFKGCIVQRRSLRYRPHRPIRLPVEMLLVCKDVACDANSTCARTGKCVPAAIDDPSACGAVGCFPVGDGPSPTVPGNGPPGGDGGPMNADGESGADGSTSPDGGGEAGPDAGDGGGDAGDAGDGGDGGRVEAGAPPPVGRLYGPPVSAGCDPGDTCCWNNTAGNGGFCGPMCPPKAVVPMKCSRIADCQVGERCCGTVINTDNGMDPPVRTFTDSHCLATQIQCPGVDICLGNPDCLVGQCDLATALFNPTGIYGECK